METIASCETCDSNHAVECVHFVCPLYWTTYQFYCKQSLGIFLEATFLSLLHQERHGTQAKNSTSALPYVPVCCLIIVSLCYQYMLTVLAFTLKDVTLISACCNVCQCSFDCLRQLSIFKVSSVHHSKLFYITSLLANCMNYCIRFQHWVLIHPGHVWYPVDMSMTSNFGTLLGWTLHWGLSEQ